MNPHSRYSEHGRTSVLHSMIHGSMMLTQTNRVFAESTAFCPSCSMLGGAAQNAWRAPSKARCSMCRRAGAWQRQRHASGAARHHAVPPFSSREGAAPQAHPQRSEAAAASAGPHALQRQHTRCGTSQQQPGAPRYYHSVATLERQSSWARRLSQQAGRSA